MTERTAVEVYWRPGCNFCMMLRPRLRLAGVPLREHNIWKDERAAVFVRSVADGNETVPTVVVGDRAMVNPSSGRSWPRSRNRRRRHGRRDTTVTVRLGRGLWLGV